MDRSTPQKGARLRARSLAVCPQRHNRVFSTNNKKKIIRSLFRLLIAVIAVSSLTLVILLVRSYRTYAKIVDGRLARGYLVSRSGIYAAPRVLQRGQRFTSDGLVAALRRAGYIEGDEATEIWNGSFSVVDKSIEIRSNELSNSGPVTVAFDQDGRIADLTSDGVAIDSFTLAPESLTNDSLTKGGARRQLGFKEIPPVLIHAITSIEDHRFFEHHGLDLFGVARALVRNAGEERAGQGGSTITQQLVKNTYLTPERTLRRKYAEAMLAFTLERRLSKEDIFALYCNEIYLGQRSAFAVRGVDQAARVYFGKQLRELTLGEAATIAGMIQSPSRYSPVNHNEEARVRRNTVLGTMLRDGFITQTEAEAAAQEPLAIAQFDPARESVAPYFIDYVNRLTDGRAMTNDTLSPTPLITTLDLDLQQVAGEAIRHQLNRLDTVYKARGATPQATLVAMDPNTGEVVAMVGGRDYAATQLNRATDAKRQPGSVFKPFVYAAALETGMSPLAMFKDAPQEFTYAGGSTYRPSNYGGAFSMQDVTMRTGLIKSLNVVTVDVAMHTGLARVANTAADFGLPRPKPYPALALGTTEATPLQMATAYATFANGGDRIQPHVIHDPVAGSERTRIIHPETAFIITDMLEGVIDHGTAHAARGSVKGTAIAGKTGTSRDGWFIGYTPNLVCAVWVGFDDNKQLGLTGAEAALPVWTEFMRSAIDLRPELGGRAFVQPDGVTIVDIDPETEELATGKCPMHEYVALLSTEAPKSECFRHNIYFDLGAEPSEQEFKANPAAKPSESRHIDPSAYAQLHYTRIETDQTGRKILVNDMRAVRQ